MMTVLKTVVTATALSLLLSFVFLVWKWSEVTCTCKPSDSPLEELHRSSAVFVGKVIRIEYPKPTGFLFNARDPEIVTFQISKVWKGPATRTIDVRTWLFGTCGCKFTEDEDYLVYADSSGQQLVTDRCTRTKSISDAIAEVAELGEGQTLGTEDATASSNPIVSSISPRTLAQYEEATLVVIGANFMRGARVVFDGPQFHLPVELDATFENSSILTVSTSFEPPIFSKEPFVGNHQWYKVNVKNSDGHLSSAAIHLDMIGIVDLLEGAEFSGTMSQEQRVNLAHKAGLKVVENPDCPGSLSYMDPETNRTLNQHPVMLCVH